MPYETPKAKRDMLARGQQTTECARSLARSRERETAGGFGAGPWRRDRQTDRFGGRRARALRYRDGRWEITCVIDVRAFTFDWLGVFDLRRG
jgi:hypothetical protein